jgi:U3 small nucleolar RNA-associated protein 19
MTATAAATSTSSAETAALLKRLLVPETSNDRANLVRLDELRKVFAKEFQSFAATTAGRRQPSPLQQTWQAHIQSCLDLYVTQLSETVINHRAAVRTFWGLIASCPQTTMAAKNKHNSTCCCIHEGLMIHFIRALTQRDVVILQHVLQNEFLNPFVDARYAAVVAIANVATELYKRHATAKTKQQLQSDRLFQVLSMIHMPGDQDELEESADYLFAPSNEKPVDTTDADNDTASDSSDSDDSAAPPLKKPVTTHKASFATIRAHRRVWLKAWLAVMKLPLSNSSLKAALQQIPTKVLPNVSSPLQFADFFMTAYNGRGVIPVLALEGLFVLIASHNLEYPDFYKQLYRLVTPSLLVCKYKNKFFDLLETCLARNDLLPAHVVAAFCKRLLRAALTAPPASALFAIALVSNLLRKYPQTHCLTHRDGGHKNAHDAFLTDGFDANTNDPELANALCSSLWELHVLERHYYAPIATLAQSVGRDLDAPLHDVRGAFLGHTYKSLSEQERKRKRKAPLTFSKPSALFVDSDVFAGMLSVLKKSSNVTPKQNDDARKE